MSILSGIRKGQNLGTTLTTLLAMTVEAHTVSAQSCGSLQDLGTLGGRDVTVRDISADGSVVVGDGYLVSGESRAFRWTTTGGMEFLGTLGGIDTRVVGASAGGDVVVGNGSLSSGGVHAFRWTAFAGIQDLGTLGGGSDYSFARGVSADGSVIAGDGSTSAGASHAFRWTASGGIQDLGTLGGRDSWVGGVSADGGVLVGWSISAAGQFRAFRWTPFGGMQDLGMQKRLSDDSIDVSADGSVIVGSVTNATAHTHAFRWTASEGMQDLGTLGGNNSYALGVSADGSVIVGWSNTADANHAFRWTAAGGMKDLGTLGGRYSEARAISADGSVIVGTAYTGTGSNHAFRWTASEGMKDLEALGGDVSFGTNVSADGSVIVGVATGAAMDRRVFRWGDIDSDGIPDDWEVNGVPYINPTGSPARFVLDTNGDGISDADCRHKDLFVEIDALDGHMISAGAMDLVSEAFRNAPLSNPDGKTGITLHLQVSDTSIPVGLPWNSDTTGWPNEFDIIKAVYFGSGGAAHPASKAKARVFRYCIIADQIDRRIVGRGELPGNDFFLTLGEYGKKPSQKTEAGAFMHELGHTLGLGHGGDTNDGIIGKPNYVSVMNYALWEPMDYSKSFWKLDYSREALATLNEAVLNEPAGIRSTKTSNFKMPFGVDDVHGNRVIDYVYLDGRATDWNHDGDKGDSTAVQDLNYLGPTAPFAGVSSPSFPQTALRGHHDWAGIQLKIGTTGDFADLVHDSVPKDEVTGEFADWMQRNFVDPCRADFNHDGFLTGDDYDAYVDSFVAGDSPADFNGDGFVTGDDFDAYSAAFVAGC